MEEKQKLNIAFILPSTGISGGVLVVFEIINHLLDRGHNAYILSLTNGVFNGWYPYSGRIFHLKDAQHICNTADILVATLYTTAFWLEQQDTLADKWYLVQHRESLFSTERGFRELGMENSAKEAVKYYRAFVEKSYALPFKYITVSRWLSNFLTKEYGHKPLQITNGLNHDIFYPEPYYPKTKFRLLIEATTQEQPWKGLDDAREAIKGLKDIEIWTISSDNNRFPSDKHFQSPTQDEIRRIYSSCDALLKPSWYEGFGLGPLQAMACGCAVITTDNLGSREYATDKNSIIIKPRDIKGMKSAIRELQENPERKKSIIKEGLKTAKKFTWEPQIDKVEKAFMSAYTPIKGSNACSEDEMYRYLNPQRERAIKEIQGFTGNPREYIEKRMTRTADTMAAEWRTQNPRTPEHIEYYYRKTDGYIYDLPWINTSPTRFKQAREIFDLIQKSQIHLDFGGGAGDLCIQLSEWGFRGKIILYDIPSKTNEFAKYRISERGIKNIEVTNQLDGITVTSVSVIDVLEHLYDVESAVRQIADILLPSGLLYASSAFHLVNEHYPCHLPQNTHWENDIDGLLESLGLKKVKHNIYIKQK